MSLIEKLRMHDFWNTPEDESEALLVEAADALTEQAERVRVLVEALSAIVRLSEEVDELPELSAKEIIQALVKCEQTARAALAKAGAPE